ncbi:MAG: hypothetical protein ACYC3X_03520 [Pirellulaceae bacterium]
MNHMLPIPLAVILLVAAWQFVGGGSLQGVDKKEVTSERRPAVSEPAASTSQEALNGQELVAQAAQRLLLLPGIEATTRQRVSIFGQHLVGSGTYLQLANGPRLMLRLDLKLQVAAQATSLQQISDGDTFWVRHSLGDTTSLTRVNLRRLREAASRVGPSDVPPPPTLWMALGGLPKLLSALDAHFAFDPPKPMTIGQLPVWSLEGHWKPAMLANLLPDQKAAIEAGEPVDLSGLPPHLPHGVTLILGRDQVIPLFPYGISYYRLAAGEGDAASARRQPMATWELFDVRFRPDLDASQFDYRPHDSQQVDERTDEYIARLQAAMDRPGPPSPTGGPATGSAR